MAGRGGEKRRRSDGEREKTAEGREAEDERERKRKRGKGRERERNTTAKEEKRETAKSVNFLTFYEPSEFHNLEPVRVVLCTRKVSALSFSSIFLAPVALLWHFRGRAKMTRGRKAWCMQSKVIAR